MIRLDASKRPAVARRSRSVVCLAAVAAAVAGIAAESATAAGRDARKSIQAIYDARVAAYQRHDVSGILAAYLPQFTLEDLSRMTLRLPRLKQSLEALVPHVISTRMNTRIRKFQQQADTATVVAQHHRDMRILDPHTGLASHIVDDTVTQDTWVRTSYGWMERRSRELSRKHTFEQK